MQRTIILGIIALATLSAGASPGMAAGAVAAGVPSDVAKQGISLWTQVNERSTAEARQKALAGCKSVGSDASKALCQIAATFSNQCVAEALDPQDGTPGYGWAIASNSTDAKAQALANCRATAGPTRQDACIVASKGVWCDGSAK